MIFLLPGSWQQLTAQHSLVPKGQPQQAGSVSPNWSSWESVQAVLQKEKRKTLVSIYTDWCGWCKKMETETFSHPMIARYMNEHFNLVKFNAEQKEEILYKGKKYGYSKMGLRGYNEWATELLNGRLSFPTLVFLNEEEGVIQPISGYKSPEELLPILMYIGSNEYKTKPWTIYQKEFRMPEEKEEPKHKRQ